MTINIENISAGLPDAPLKGNLIIFEGEEYEILMVAYDQIFAVTNNKWKAGKIIDINEYIEDAEIRMKEERMENELARELDK